MTMAEKKTPLSVGKAARRAIRRHFDQVTTVGFVQIVLRVAVFSPLLLTRLSGGKLPAWICWAGVAALYIALVIPLRFWAREKLRRLFYTRNQSAKKRNVYQKWLKTGLLRYLRGILWGLPFLAGAVYFTVFRRILDAKTMWMPIRQLAVLVGREPDITTGGLIALGLMAVFGLLFAYGWWRDLPLEYMPVRSLGPIKSLHWSRRILKKHRGEMRKGTAVNFFLSLPAVIGAVAVLVPYVMKQIDFSLGGEMVLNMLLRLLRSPLPRMILLELAGVAVVLYLPLWGYRKMRNAALIAQLMHENSDHTHHHHHHSDTQESAAQESAVQEETGDDHAIG